MKLSIVTLNFKKKDLTIACLDSLYKHYKSYLEKGDMEVIVVDNKSEDDSVKGIRDAIKTNAYANVHLIANTENAGFGKGCNLGASHAKGHYVLFLNNDTQVEGTGFMDMVRFLDTHTEVAILGGRMKNEDGTLQASAGKFYTLMNAALMLLGMQRFGLLYTSPSRITKVDWVSGGCMMVRKDIFGRIGGFDKDIFMYMEDVELCFRAKKAGYMTYFYPQVTTFHIGQGSSNRTFAIMHIYKGLLHFYKKYMPKWQVNVLQLMLKAKAIILVQIGKATRNSYLVQTYEQALTAIR